MSLSHHPNNNWYHNQDKVDGILKAQGRTSEDLIELFACLDSHIFTITPKNIILPKQVYDMSVEDTYHTLAPEAQKNIQTIKEQGQIKTMKEYKSASLFVKKLASNIFNLANAADPDMPDFLQETMQLTLKENQEWFSAFNNEVVIYHTYKDTTTGPSTEHIKHKNQSEITQALIAQVATDLEHHDTVDGEIANIPVKLGRSRKLNASSLSLLTGLHFHDSDQLN